LGDLSSGRWLFRRCRILSITLINAEDRLTVWRTWALFFHLWLIISLLTARPNWFDTVNFSCIFSLADFSRWSPVFTAILFILFNLIELEDNFLFLYWFNWFHEFSSCSCRRQECVGAS
jgi:hypothetical protein